jgi:hypothetical protein
MECAEVGLKTSLPAISEAMLPNADVTLSPKRPMFPAKPVSMLLVIMEKNMTYQ